MSEKDVNDQAGTLEQAIKLGLKEEEFSMIKSKLGRQPTFTELAMFSGMWSEHCSYKNSILLLKELYSESPLLLAARGEENAGALKINDKQAVVFKIESHNHPSAIEPYQGAATGVGGIMRDIFTMGARPLVSLNSLRFGSPEENRNCFLLKEVVKGIGDYGNSLGIPCAGGEIFFDSSYSKNPLVNAMTVGIAEISDMASARASGPGNIVLYVGSKTGRDGIHGASFASKNLSDESEEERSAVQVGDPFMEKLLMEATLECIGKKLIVAVQDMGAAGLLSSSSEMSSSGNVGMDLHLEKVPARETHMLPFEYLLSESQERMLMIVEPSKLKETKQLFYKWELDCAEVGVITASKNLRVFHNGTLYADIPAKYLTVNSEGAPRYKREISRPAYLDKNRENFTLNFFEKSLLQKDISSFEKILTQIFSHPNFASKQVVYEQYDTHIGNMRIIGPGQNGAVYKNPKTNQGIAVTVDGNSWYVSKDPFEGARHTIAESYRNIVATGSLPIGITNCLNFANPYIPENFYFFENAVKGMSSAAENLKLPVTGGNVSFYNESKEGPVLPTPTIGMVGLIDNINNAISCQVKNNSCLFLTGFFQPAIEPSLYAQIIAQKNSNILPQLSLENEKICADAILKNIDLKLVESAIDLSFGGLMVALFKLIFATINDGTKNIGFKFDNSILTKVSDSKLNIDTFFWGETAHTYLVSVSGKNKEQYLNSMNASAIPVIELGTFNETGMMAINELNLEIKKIFSEYNKGLSRFFK